MNTTTLTSSLPAPSTTGWGILQPLRRLAVAMVRHGGTFLARWLYRIRTEDLPKDTSGGLLLVGNHVSYADAVILQATFPRPIRFIGAEGLTRIPVLSFLFRLSGAIPVSPRKPRRALALAAHYLRQGEVVCIFPEGGLTRDGQIAPFRAGFAALAKSAGVPILPFHLHGAWGSVLSHFRDHLGWWRRVLPWHREITLRYGTKQEAPVLEPAQVRQTVHTLGVRTWDQESMRREEKLGERIWSALRRNPRAILLHERHPRPSRWRRGSLLALAWTLQEDLLQNLPDRRIGLALPPGLAGTVANLAVLLSGKIPVNLNVTAGERGFGAALEDGEIRHILTAGPIMDKFPQLPWGTVQTHDLASILGQISAGCFLRAWVKAVVLPRRWVRPAGLVAAGGGDAEAVLLFTSGSSGRPKGVPLSHRNLLGNVGQIEATGLLQKEDRLVACLPLFHSFGLTVTLLYPLLRGLRMVSLPSPLDSKAIARAIQEEKATILAGTATFLRPYPRMEPALFSSLRLVVAGAEKVPAALREAFAQQLNVPLLEGYGLTETSPVATVNLPDHAPTGQKANASRGNKPGSAGRLLPGLEGRLIHPETGQPVPTGESGLLLLRGINVFRGYLGQAAGAALDENGWYATGDLASFDADGFLYLEGRLSRFSKIGGEMVSHGAIEEILHNRWAAERPLFAVAAKETDSGGENLILFHPEEINPGEIREALREAGLPALWIPKTYRVLETIPSLGTGKLDLAALRERAAEKEN